MSPLDPVDFPRVLFHLGAFYHLSVRLVTAISQRNEFLSAEGLSSN